MSATAEVLLGVIALSVLVMAAIQVGAIIAGLRLAKRVDGLAKQIDQDLKPLISNLTAMTSEAARATALASRQIDRADQLFGEMASRVDETLSVAQQLVKGPARSGLAILSGVQAAVSALRGIREAGRRRRTMGPTGHGAEDDESLFIG